MLTLTEIKPDFVYRNDKVVAAIIDIDIFNELIEKFEDEEDIAYLKEARNKTMDYRKFGEYLTERENV
ncbi:MAG: hypothetical protein NT007_01030 [Candidatus Kapabacteria bacterium]|nr:hypothetical protein [Candidatus Kapabacteria bacterium]